MNNNPLMQFFQSQSPISPQLMDLMQYANNPQKAIEALVKQCPQLAPLLNMQGQMTPQSLEQLCRISCQQQGLDFDSVYKQAEQIMSNFRR